MTRSYFSFPIKAQTTTIKRSSVRRGTSTKAVVITTIRLMSCYRETGNSFILLTLETPSENIGIGPFQMVFKLVSNTGS